MATNRKKKLNIQNLDDMEQTLSVLKDKLAQLVVQEAQPAYHCDACDLWFGSTQLLYDHMYEKDIEHVRRCFYGPGYKP